jgi:molybdopterin molybdotransferase
MKDMLGREELITVEKALYLLFQYVPFKMPAVKKVSIEKAYNLVTSQDIISPENLPAFNRSTVDGFAVNAADTFGATESMPAYLNIVNEILMGEEPNFALKRGEVAKISTGGMLPSGADSVVMFEYTQYIDEKTLEVLKPVSPGENVIQAGEDAKKGEVIFKTGHRLRPQDIGALAGIGLKEVEVYEKPIVSIISTGDEIVPAGMPVKPGQVRDINTYTLSCLIEESGGIPLRKGIFKDNYELIYQVLKESIEESSMVIISGGSSVGAKDVTEKVINDIGTPGVLFHGVTLKPGKPTIGGIIDNVPVLGLPGHPGAVIICFNIFVKPLILELSGTVKEKTFVRNRIIKAKINRNISSSPGREEHIAVKLEEINGELCAVPLLAKSGIITTLTQADGIVIIPVFKTGIIKDEIVEVRLF